MRRKAVSEREFVKKIGIPRRKLADFRETLETGRHWFKEGRLIYWTEVGQEAVLLRLGLKKTELPLPPPILKDKEDIDAIIEPPMAFVMFSPKNRRVLVAALKKNSERITVRVRNNAKFPAGFEIPVRKIDGMMLWELARKEPRWFGRW